MDDLKSLAPMLAGPEPSADARNRSRNRLDQRMRGLTDGPGRHTSRRRSAGLGLTAAGAAAAAAVAVATSSTAPSAPHTAQQFLLAAAVTAARQPAATGRYWYFKEVFEPATPANEFEQWTTRDGQQWFRGAKTHYKVVNVGISQSPFNLGGIPLTSAQVQALPTDPRQLQAWITTEVRKSHLNMGTEAQEVFNTLVAVVGPFPAPPAVRAAAFQAIAQYPNVKDLGKADSGVLLEFPVPSGNSPGEMIIDPSTSRIISTTYLVGTGYTDTAAPGERITVASGWTNRLP